MWSLFVVPGDPGIEVSLQLLEAGVDAFAERHLIELLQDGFVEALADAVGLRASRLGAAVVDVLDGQIELVFMRLGGAAEFRAAVGQHAAEFDVVLVEERHDAVVDQVGGGDRGLAVIQLGERHLRIGVDQGLLVDPAHPLEGADIEGVLCPAVARALALELAMRLVVLAGPLGGRQPGLR